MKLNLHTLCLQEDSRDSITDFKLYLAGINLQVHSLYEVQNHMSNKIGECVTDPSKHPLGFGFMLGLPLKVPRKRLQFGFKVFLMPIALPQGHI